MVSSMFFVSPNDEQLKIWSISHQVHVFQPECDNTGQM